MDSALMKNNKIDEEKIVNMYKKNYDFFNKNIKMIRKNYGGKYVAIENAKIIKNDINLQQLFERLKEDNKNIDVILVKFVEKENIVYIY